MKRFILIAVLILLPFYAYAGTCGHSGDSVGSTHCTEGGDAVNWTADSCSDDDVEYCVETCANDDDVVNIPAGSCTWVGGGGGENEAVYVGNKQITITGAGEGSTNITWQGTDDYDSGAFTVLNQGTPKENFIISDITFIFDTAEIESGPAVLIIWDAGNGTRVHDCTFNTLRANGVQIRYGRNIADSFPSVGMLVDNCTFNLATTSGNFKAFSILGSDWGDEWPTVGMISWTTSWTHGSQYAIYIEDCTFTSSQTDNVLYDGDNGGRIVFRHNTVTGSSLNTHGSVENDEQGGNLVQEVYNNTFNANGVDLMHGIGFRSGTGYIHNNTFTGYGDDGAVRFYLYCGCESAGSCSGAYACTEYPCEGQMGRGVNQALDPIYMFNNTYTTSLTVTIYDSEEDQCGAVVDTYVLENRDWYEEDVLFDGTAGTGSGTLANRPATCTTTGSGFGPAYWATDESKLYICSATNTWTDSYSPYTYPHPLRGSVPVDKIIDGGTVSGGKLQ